MRAGVGVGQDNGKLGRGEGKEGAGSQHSGERGCGERGAEKWVRAGQW